MERLLDLSRYSLFSVLFISLYRCRFPPATQLSFLIFIDLLVVNFSTFVKSKNIFRFLFFFFFGKYSCKVQNSRLTVFISFSIYIIAPLCSGLLCVQREVFCKSYLSLHNNILPPLAFKIFDFLFVTGFKQFDYDVPWCSFLYVSGD